MQNPLSSTRKVEVTLANTVLFSAMGHSISHRSECFSWGHNGWHCSKRLYVKFSPYVKTLSWITRHFIVGLSRALNMPVNQMLWLGTHLLLSQKELQNLERKKALVCTCCKGTGHTKRTYLAKGDYDEQHDLRDDAFEGDDLDMPDRDDEHVGDNLFLGPRGTSNNVYHNT
ncbi:uncharacterized protein LOC107469398 [Arachis duranensis]|uniref:Uncharacterized protein LOC107469398 n=1 Tax=Arachis duranensis TaxID=130453 RepID=A0A9C6WIG6_ARADU|nr:uncharacterized protein LOC107469398 [Arachis duranensis]